MKSRLLALLGAIAMVASLLIGVSGEALAVSTSVGTVADLEAAVANAVAGDVIQIDPGVYQLTGPLSVGVDNLTLEGTGPKAASVELRAANNQRVFDITAVGAALRSLTITGGTQNNDKGGGIRVATGAQLDLIDVEVLNNFADEGGGLYNAGTVTISGTLFEGNDARRKGGGIENDGLLTILNSTLTDNEGKGGGGLSTAGTANLSFVTIFSNRSTNKIGAGTLRNGGVLAVKNSIIANNTGSDGDIHDCSGTPNLQNVIVTSDQGCNPEGTYDVAAPDTVVDPVPAANNGGPTRTLALLPTSPAIDYTTDCTDLADTAVVVDQRGVGRVDSSCDLGAFEVDTTPPTITITTPADGAEYQQDSVVPADYSCSDTQSSAVLCEGPVQVGDPIDTATPGSKIFTVTATDTAGNVTSASVTYEVLAPLALEVALATAPTQIEVGAVTVPLDNITVALQSAADSGTPIASTPLSAVPLSAVTLKDAPLSAVPLSAVPLSAVPLSAVPLSAVPLSAVPLSAVPLSAVGDVLSLPLSAVPLSSILLSELTTFDGSSLEWLVRGSDLEGVPLQATHLGDLISIPLSAVDLNVSPLSAIPLSSISPEIQQEICGAPCSGTTLGGATITGGVVGDVLAMNDLGFASTPLSAVPLSAILLGFTPLSSIPLSAVDGTLSGLDAWCYYLGSAQCSTYGINPATGNDGGQSVLSLSLQGAPLSAVPLSAVPLSAIGDFASTPLAAIPLSAVSWVSTPLSAVPLSAVTTSTTPLSAVCVDIGGFACTASSTLGEVAAAGAFVDGVTLTVFENYVGPPDYSLADLIVGLVEPVDLAWEVFEDLNALALPDAADNTGTIRALFGDLKQPSFDYQITIDVEGPDALVDVGLTLPPGFAFARPDGTVPDSSVPFVRLDGEDQLSLTPVSLAADSGATCLGSGDLAFLDLSLSAGTYLLEVPVWAGLDLGTYEVSATICGEANTQSDAAGPATASIEVIAETQATEELVDGNLELSHIDTVGEIQVYDFEIPTNAQARIILSNLDADLDLTLFGPPLQDPLRGEPQVGYGLVEDFLFDLNPDDDALDPDALQDLPLDPPAGSVLHAVSANRGTTDEIINTGTLRPGTYQLQVSGYNGATSSSPFALRATATEIDLGTCSAPRLRGVLSGGGTNPAAPTGINTVFLYNSAWLNEAFPAGAGSVVAALNAVQDDLTGQWAALGVDAAAVAIDDYGIVRTSLNNWDANRCDPLAANDVVRAIGSAVLDPILAANPDLEYVVIVGDDSQVPFARMLDGAFVSNESQHGLTIGTDGELRRALGNGYYLSDDPYGADRGIAIADREFFVPELAVGRLVEEPADITGALDNFLDYGGVLDARTASDPASVTTDPKALVTAYDFLVDGGEDVVSGLLASGFSVDADLSETWTSDSLYDPDTGSGLLTGGDLAAVSLNAHFDESRLLPADQNLAGTETNLFDVGDYLGVPGLEGVIIFTMGCHSALSVSDVQITAGNEDWAETSAARGNAWLGNTGYGYGDTEVSALSERLSANFAGNLETMTVGEALVAAKQEYVSSLYTVTPYDLKISEEFTYYGLPMFTVGARPAPVAPAPAQTSAPTVFNDPFTGLESSTLSLDFSGLGNTTSSWIGAGEDLLQVRGRALLPQTTIDVTSEGREAGGVLITGLTSSGPGSFDPLIFNPVAGVDYTGTGSTVRPQAGESTFPAHVVGPVKRFGGPDGVLDRAVVVPARHVTENGADTLEIFSSVELQTLYRPAGGDREAPFIERSIGRYDGTSIVHFDVTIPDTDVERVLVLFRAEDAAGPWLPVDLVQVPGEPRWLGGRPNNVPGESGPYEYIVQAVDSSANLSRATGKGINFETVTPALNQGVTVTVQDSGTPVLGWYPGRAGDDVIARATSTEAITSYTLDGISNVASGTSIDIPIEGDGGHLLQVFAGTKQGLLFVAIDGTGPQVQATSAPVAGSTARLITISAIDPFGSGVERIEYNDGDGWQIYTGPFVQSDSATVQYRAFDFVGNVSAVGTLQITVYYVCLQYDPDKAQPDSGAVPIKLQLCDSAGNNESAANIDLTAEEIRVESNGMTLYPGPNDTGNANEDFLFRYKSKGYIYNLNTTEVTDVDGNFVPLGPGTFTLLFSASTTGPDVLYEARFTLR